MVAKRFMPLAPAVSENSGNVFQMLCSKIQQTLVLEKKLKLIWNYNNLAILVSFL